MDPMKVAGVIVVPCAALLGCAPELNWREVRIDEAGIVQMFPCRPLRQQRSPVVDGKTRPMALYVCDAGQASWALSVIDPGDLASVPGAMQALADASRANLGLADRATASAAAGEGYRLQGYSPDGRPVELSGRVAASGSKVLQWSVIGARVPAADADAFVQPARVAR